MSPDAQAVAMSLPAQSLPFLHPALAWTALAAGALPVVIHLINRRRYRQVAWAAMAFLMAANRRSRRRLRMEQWLLMLTRIAAIVLLGLAAARPFVSAAALGGFGAARVHRIVVLDNSLSMLARTNGGTPRFAQALETVEDLLSAFPNGDVVSLVTTATPAEAVLDDPVSDLRVARERAQALAALPKPADWTRAVTLVREIARRSPLPTGNQAVFVISDFRRVDWIFGEGGREPDTAGTVAPAAAALRRLAEESGPTALDVQAVKVGGAGGENVGLSDLTMESTLLAPRLPARAVVRVVNHTERAQRDLVVQLRRGGQLLRRELVPDIPVGGAVTVTAPLEFATAGTHLLEAELEGAARDALAIDNARYLSAEVRERVAVLLVDGRPGATPLSGETGYLATALQPTAAAARVRDAESSLIEVKVVSVVELGGEVLDEYDVLGLCNVPRLGARDWERIGEAVARGCGLLVTAGDQVSVEHYNDLGRGAGGSLVPGLLSAAATPGGAADAAGGFQLAEPVHPMVAEFARFSDSGLFSARVDRYLPLTPDARGVETVLRFRDGAAALVVGTHGQGRTAYFGTTVNMAWTNLPARGDFVSLMLNVTSYLAPRRGAQRNLLAGETLREPLLAAQSGLPLRVTTADGQSHEPRRIVDDGAWFVQFGPVEQVGPLMIAVGGEQKPGCVNVDGRSLDVAAPDRRTLQQALGARVTIREGGAGEAAGRGRATEMARMFLIGGGLLLLAEMWMAMRFGVRYTRE